MSKRSKPLTKSALKKIIASAPASTDEKSWVEAKPTSHRPKWTPGWTKKVILSLLGLIILALVVKISLGLLANRQPAQELVEAQTYYQKAVEVAGQGDWVTAKVYLEKALQKHPSLDWRAQLAVVNYNLGNYDQAKRDYQQLIEAKKDLAFAYNGLGNIDRDLKNHSTAEQRYLKAIDSDPSYLVAYSNLAIMLNDLGQKEKAISLLDRAIEQTGSHDLKELKTRLNL